MEEVDAEPKPAIQLASFNAERMAEVEDIDKEDEVCLLTITLSSENNFIVDFYRMTLNS